MNWYYEINGISHGPQSDAEMTTLLEQQQITEASLIWNPSLENWAPAAELKPLWLKATPPPIKPATEPITTHEDLDGAAESDSDSATPRRGRAVATNNTSKPSPSRLMSQESADTPAKNTPAPPKKKESPPKKGGLLKRLFGGKDDADASK